MKKNICRTLAFFCCLLSGIFALGSCSNFTTKNSFSGGTAQITLTQGTEDEVFTFNIPVDDEADVYAQQTTAADDAGLKAYLLQAKNGYEKPFETFYIKFVPSQVNSQGEVISPYATVVFTEFSIEEGTYFYPSSRTFFLNEETSFSSADYSLATGSGGKISFDWSVNDENSVKASQVYSNYEVKSYSLKSVKFTAELK